MLRRDFLAGAGALTLSGCWSPFAEEIDLPDPVQVNQSPWAVAPGMMGLAKFSARVLVLSRRDYPTASSDTLSAVSPSDLAVAWGLAARTDVRRAVELSQSDRRYNWRARKSDMGLSGVRHFTSYSGNWHMIPASPEVARDLARVMKDDVVSIEGDLVQVTFTNGVYYRSSTARDDVGDGACEIVRARSIVVEARNT